MPTMVMSQPPKTLEANPKRNRRQKNKDKIMPISYMYVGTPKKKLTFYVRERLVYRSNVEVTYDDVYNYLANITNDDTVSLHYSVNGSYVPITTTGQLHTFLRHVHNDPNAFLYVENHDYVWNVTPQTKGHKTEKRNPNSDAADPEDDDDEEVTASEGEEEEGEEEGGVEGGDGGGDSNDSAPEGDNNEAPPVMETQTIEGDESGEEYDDEEADDEEYDEDEEEEEEDDDSIYGEQVERVPLTDPNARVIYAQLAENVEELSEDMDRMNIEDGDERTISEDDGFPRQCEGEAESYAHIKKILSDALLSETLEVAPGLLAQQIVRDVWSPSMPYNEHVFKGAVDMLKASLGIGLLNYYQQCFEKYAPTADNTPEGILMEKMILNEYMPDHDPEILNQFLESACISACDIVECMQNLNRLEREISYFGALNLYCEKLIEKLPAEPTDTLPSDKELNQHMHAALASTYYGFQMLQPVFPKGCKCKDAITNVANGLHECVPALVNASSSSSDSERMLMKTKIIMAIKVFLDNYLKANCPLHATLEAALADSELQKWRPEKNGDRKWRELSKRGIYRDLLVSRYRDVQLDAPISFSRIPSMIANPLDPNIHPITEIIPATGVHIGVQPMDPNAYKSEEPPLAPVTSQPTQSVATQATQENTTTTQASKPVATKKKEKAPAAAVETVDAATSADDSTAPPAEEEKKEEMSPTLKKMVAEMVKKSPAVHHYVYPPAPKPGTIMVPTGGFAKCRCTKNCQEDLLEPAFEYFERFNEPRTPTWEKTKQKRFKKN